MNSREQILDQIRANLGRHAPAVPEAPPPVPLWAPVDLDVPARIAEFGRRLAALNGVLHEAAPADVLAALLAATGAQKLARSDAPAVAALAADPRFLACDWLPPDATKEQLFAADLGITTAQWGIAETGTLVLDSEEERSRLASLVPPVHLCLLPTSHLLCNLGELLKTVGRPLPPALTFVTGPSRTADIELQLVLGVHGPRELHVVLV
jgi:L-lactate dehydrogenase complex protein LldG